MIRASSLFYAMVLSLLLAAVLGSIILNAHLHNYRAERWLALNGARDNVYSALFRSDEAIAINAQNADSSDLFGGTEDPVRIAREAWGLFDLRTCSAWKSDQRYERSALIGEVLPADMPSLYVADQHEPIALAGDTRIEGVSFLPANGCRRAYIEGRPYSGPLSFVGSRNSERRIPDLPQGIRERIARTFDRRPAPGERMVRWSSIGEDSISVPFDAPALFIDMGAERVLAQRHVQGHVLIDASDTITVLPSFTCTDIVLRAPFVRIAKGCRLSMQCFVRSGLVAEEDVHLTYPSMLVCGTDTGDARPTVVLTSGSSCEGAIIACASERSPSSDRVVIELQRNVTFTGELWNEGPVQLSGTFRGCALVGSLVVRTPSSVYRGHLLDADIGPMREERTIGAGIWSEGKQPGVLRWNPLAL